MNICTTKFAFKENKKAYKYNLASQARIVAERVAIAKPRTKSCKKIFKKVFDTFTIETCLDGMDDIMFPYK